MKMNRKIQGELQAAPVLIAEGERPQGKAKGDLTSIRRTLSRESTRSRFKRVEEYKNGGAYHMGAG